MFCRETPESELIISSSIRPFNPTNGSSLESASDYSNKKKNIDISIGTSKRKWRNPQSFNDKRKGRRVEGRALNWNGSVRLHAMPLVNARLYRRLTRVTALGLHCRRIPRRTSADWSPRSTLIRLVSERCDVRFGPSVCKWRREYIATITDECVDDRGPKL
jgi:hypothetical protein